jgi:hypothetical protein
MSQVFLYGRIWVSPKDANARITMEMYTQALPQDKRNAQTKVVQMMLPKAAPPLAKAG